MVWKKGELAPGATPFQPGESGNPGGRPKGESFTSLLRELLDTKHKRAPNWRAAVAAKAIDLAAKGDLDAIKWIADRTDGKVADRQVVAGDGEHPVRVEVTYRDETIPREHP